MGLPMSVADVGTTEHLGLIGQKLLKSGLINASQLELALAQQKSTHAFLGKTLVAMGAISTETLAEALAAEAGVDVIDFSHKVRLGDRLLKMGTINEAQLSLALREQARLGGYLGDTLVNLGFIAKESLTDALANEAAVDVVDLNHALLDDELIKLVPYDVAKRYKVLPLSIENNRLTIAMADTFNVIAIDSLSKITGKVIEVVGASESAIMEILDHHYSQALSIEETMDLILREGITSEDDAEESPLVRLVDQILVLGIKKHATDIHIEPDEKTMRVRMRIDGVLHKIVLMPSQLIPAMTTRLKIISSLDVTERRVPQDGRASFNFGGRQVDLRISTLPTAFGENIVIRVLDKNPKKLDLEGLGMADCDYDLFTSMINQPHGIILVTGPTGSGKTTTLYTALGKINSDEKSVFTLEDPIEYQLPNIRQSQINPDVGFNFAVGLRSILRQDPDVVLVGEVRDTETASLAVRAALTGHLVLTTLHTNDAPGAIPRLIDMGVEPYLIPACLNGVVAQRLIRRLCDHCKMEVPVQEGALSALAISDEERASARFWQAVGCPRCNQTGYQGRIALYEIMRISDQFHDAIMNHHRISNALVAESGMRRMVSDGIEKMSAGLTTLDEVIRVVNDA